MLETPTARDRRATGTGSILPMTPGVQDAQTAVVRVAGRVSVSGPGVAVSPLHVVMAARLGLAAVHGDADLWPWLVSFRCHKSKLSTATWAAEPVEIKRVAVRHRTKRLDCHNAMAYSGRTTRSFRP